MNFSVFESLAGSVTAFSAVFGSLFVGIVLWRVGATMIGSFRELSDSEGELSVDEWLWFFLKVMAFLMLCGGFLYATT
jgi:hypothetical protein